MRCLHEKNQLWPASHLIMQTYWLPVRQPMPLLHMWQADSLPHMLEPILKSGILVKCPTIRELEAILKQQKNRFRRAQTYS